MGRLSEESAEREDLLREIEDELDTDLGLERDTDLRASTRTATPPNTKLTPLNFAAYAVGAAAVVWIAFRLLPLAFFLLKWVVILGAVGWFVLWWMGRKRR